MEKTVKTKLFIGIDVHKRQWSVSVFTAHLHHKTFSQAPDPEVLKAYIDKHFLEETEVICAYEACKFGYWIHRELENYGYECQVINPADIPTTNKEVSEKTDPVDSRKIAKALRAGMLRGIYVPNLEIEGHRQLFRYRKKLWADLVRVKNRIKDKLISSGVGIPTRFDNPYWAKAFLQWLKEVELPSTAMRTTLDLLLKQYEQVHRHFLDTSIEVRKLQRLSRYKRDAKLLCQIPGIGPLTTVQLLVELGDINRFTNFRKFNSYIGLKPMTHSSGDNDRKGYMTYRSHKGLRSSIVECAWTAVQHDPALLQKYEQLLSNHTKKRAIVVIARKLLSRIYHVLKTKEPYVIGLVK
jgi:transposase